MKEKEMIRTVKANLRPSSSETEIKSETSIVFRTGTSPKQGVKTSPYETILTPLVSSQQLSRLLEVLPQSKTEEILS